MTTLTPPRTSLVAAKIEHGTKIYGESDTRIRALDRVTVGFEAGRFTTIMGPSGSGKSTLLHCLAGLDSLDDGTVHIGSTELGALKDRELTLLRRDRVGFIFQAFNLIPTLTAEENILLPLSIAGVKPDEDWYQAIVTAVGLSNRLDHHPSELSGGQQQRVAAARAFVSRPDIVFADEPTGNLDSKSGAALLVFMRQAVHEFGQTIVMVTHDPIAAGYSDRIVLLDDGRVVDEMHDPNPGTVFDIIKNRGART